MNILTKLVTLALINLLLTSCSSNNDSKDSTAISIKDSFVREVPSVAMATAAFMTLSNSSAKDIYLVKATSATAKTLELHTHNKEHGMLKMRQVKDIKIPAKGSIQLKPGGLHIMLIEPTQDLTKTKIVSIKLMFKDGSSTEINAPVKSVKKPMQMSAKKNQQPAIKKAKTLDLCVNYSNAKEDEQEKIIKELNYRNQLSEKDIQNIKKSIVETSNTMCGMYMILGKPLQEKSKQLRPMVFKSIHVYPDNYYVTQMGIVVAKHERKEGSTPPLLSVEKPLVMEAPVKFIAPGGRPMH